MINGYCQLDLSDLFEEGTALDDYNVTTLNSIIESKKLDLFPRFESCLKSGKPIVCLKTNSELEKEFMTVNSIYWETEGEEIGITFHLLSVETSYSVRMIIDISNVISSYDIHVINDGA